MIFTSQSVKVSVNIEKHSGTDPQLNYSSAVFFNICLFLAVTYTNQQGSLKIIYNQRIKEALILLDLKEFSIDLSRAGVASSGSKCIKIFFPVKHREKKPRQKTKHSCDSKPKNAAKI